MDIIVLYSTLITIILFIVVFYFLKQIKGGDYGKFAFVVLILSVVVILQGKLAYNKYSVNNDRSAKIMLDEFIRLAKLKQQNVSCFKHYIKSRYTPTEFKNSNENPFTYFDKVSKLCQSRFY